MNDMPFQLLKMDSYDVWQEKNQFHVGLGVTCFVCVILYYYARLKRKQTVGTDFSNFQKTYLGVYLLAMAGDWLQGPHVWALYNSYGMSTLQIQLLFIAGFGSSLVFGTIVGSFADKYGRRNNCILYGIMYGAACLTKHFNNFWILMVGRILGGTATSILYSAFESWMVCEHNKRGFDNEMLSTLFSNAVLGNSLVAIGSGLVAQVFADNFGFVAPFDVSLVVLVIMCVVAVGSWTENYGSATYSLLEGMLEAKNQIKNDTKILCLGLIQSLFEGCMYTFVLEWTPALTPIALRNQVHNPSTGAVSEEFDASSLPHGIIFATFMVAIMAGSSIFKILSKTIAVESFMRAVLLVGAGTMLVPIVAPGVQLYNFMAFIIFEVCVGIFWPSIGFMRGKYVPEKTRSTIMNFFRIPLNLLVVSILIQNLWMATIFKICVVFLAVACVIQCFLHRMCQVTGDAKPVAANSLTQVSKLPAVTDEEKQMISASGKF